MTNRVHSTAVARRLCKTLGGDKQNSFGHSADSPETSVQVMADGRILSSGSISRTASVCGRHSFCAVRRISVIITSWSGDSAVQAATSERLFSASVTGG